MPNTLMDMFQPRSLADNEPIGFGDALAQNRQSLIGLGMGLLQPHSLAAGAPVGSPMSSALGGYMQGAQADARQAYAQAQLAHTKRQEAFQRAQAAQHQANFERQFGREPEVLRTMRAAGIDPTSPEGRALLYPKTDEWKEGKVTYREQDYPYRANLRTGQYEWGPMGAPPGIGGAARPAAPQTVIPGTTPGAATPSTTGAGGAATATQSGAIPPPLPGMEDELPSVQKDIRKKQLEEHAKTQVKDPQQIAAAQKSAADVLTALDTAEKLAINKGGLLPTTGIFGGKLTQVYQPSADLSATLNTIAGNISLDKLNAMRQASTTGASGLGAVTEPEHRMLMNSIAALEQSQGQEQLLANLKRVRATYDWIVNRTDKNAPPPFSLRPDASQPTTAGGGRGTGGMGGTTKSGVKWTVE